MSQNLHIVFLTQWYPHPEDVQSGIFIKHQAVGLAKHHRVTVIWVGPSESATRMVATEDRDYGEQLLEVRVRYPRNRRALGKAMALKKALTSVEKPDVVHLNVLDRDFPIWELWLKKIQKPFIIHEHASLYFKNYQKDGLWHASRKRLVRNAFRVCPVSRGLKNAMIDNGLEGRYVVVPNILDVPESVERKPKSDHLMLVSIGDLVNDIKRFHKIIKALKKLPGPWEYHIIGDGVDREVLELLAKDQFGSDLSRNVVFKGRLSQAEIQGKLPRFHIFLANSRYETFGLAALEALNAGVPVLSSPVGVIQKYLREGQNGMIVDNYKDYAEKIGQLWDRYDELDLQLMLPKDREELSADGFVDRIHAMYRQLGLFVD